MERECPGIEGDRKTINHPSSKFWISWISTYHMYQKGWILGKVHLLDDMHLLKRNLAWVQRI